mmetsp:Transcript_77914/g.174701  ORF Transcript_77914/g.174701 Transcript_77914/m.174701 type:complete len:249 (-) Transcript_77914:99-845(-)
MVGQQNCKFHLRGQNYEYSFQDMTQKNLDTDKSRTIRPPRGMKPPAAPLLPPGPMVVITVKPGQAGSTIAIDDPNNPGTKIQVNVPAGAKPGMKMAVPVPDKGEKVETVQEKQRKHYSTGAKVAMGTAGVAAVGGLAVAGCILGDHFSGGAVGEAIGVDISGGVEAAGEAIEGAATDAGDAIGGAAADVGDAVDPIVADAGDAIGGVAADVGDAAAPVFEEVGGFAEEAVDWFGDAGEDIGDFVMSLF